VQDVAAQYGEDPASEETRAEDAQAFGAGADAGGLDTGFMGARLTLTGPAIHALIAQVAPRFGLVIGQKLLTGAVPLIGAVAGAGTNLAFTRYYVDMAHVHFGLRAAARAHGDDAVLGHFHATLAALQNPVTRA
jgi:EcsC protein family